MSTKATIAHGTVSFDQSRTVDFHLYDECFENGVVYLELDGSIFFTADPGVVSVQIPDDVMTKIAEAWLELRKRKASASAAQARRHG